MRNRKRPGSPARGLEMLFPSRSQVARQRACFGLRDTPQGDAYQGPVAEFGFEVAGHAHLEDVALAAFFKCDVLDLTHAHRVPRERPVPAAGDGVLAKFAMLLVNSVGRRPWFAGPAEKIT